MNKLKSNSKSYIGGKVKITTPLKSNTSINIDPILKIIKSNYNNWFWGKEDLDYIYQYVNSLYLDTNFTHSKKEDLIMGFFEYASNKLTKKECIKVLDFITELKQTPPPKLEDTTIQTKDKIEPLNYKNHKIKSSIALVPPPKPNLVNVIIDNIKKDLELTSKQLFKFRKEIQKLINKKPYQHINQSLLDNSLTQINTSYQNKEINKEDLKYIINFLKSFTPKEKETIQKEKREQPQSFAKNYK